MRCPSCYCQTADDRETCQWCGHDLERACRSCGQRISVRFKFCGHCGATQTDSAARPSERQRAQGATDFIPQTSERRQLTVLVCDVVDSTALAEQLDPEDLRDTMRIYYDLCNEVVERFGGLVAGVVGDGIFVYFGHPRAYEDAAERAVGAGLALTDAVSQRNLPSGIRIRVGIATGMMVVGDVIDVGNVREREIVGSPANLASRLQVLADPNQVLISATTHNLIGSAFICEDLGEHDLKGFSTKVRAYVVTGENPDAGASKSRATSPSPPMVDREEERAQLLELWQRSKRGEGQALFLSGEPGIGKSRLVQDLSERVSNDDDAVLTFAGSPLHQHSTLYPFVQQLRHAARINSEDTKPHRRAKFDALLDPLTEGNRDRFSQLSEFVVSPTDNEGAAREPGAKRRNEQLLESIIALFETFAKRRCLLLAFEDIQWVDASSRDLLDRLVRRIATLPIFLLITCRQGEASLLPGLDRAQNLVLPPLDPESCVGVVNNVLGNRQLPSGVTDAIVARADGVPLFVEELTKSVLESQDLAPAADRSVTPSVPETLRDTLMARLDRQREARVIAQIASAIGREFSYELLAMIAPLPGPMLQSALSELVRSGLIFQRGLVPRANYTFKHALIQEIADDSLLRRQRRAVHGQIANVLQNNFLDTPAEVIGHHFAEAGEVAQASTQYERAAQVARGRSASTEAAAHYARALQLLDELPVDAERSHHQLDLLIAYGAQLIAVKGNAANEVGEAYTRALALGKSLGETDKVSRVLRGLQTYYIVRGELLEARPIGERLLDEARHADDPNLLLQAHRPYGLCLLLMGDHVSARHHLQRAIELYDPEVHLSHRFQYGSDPGVLAHCNLALVEWFLGYPESAISHAQRAIQLSEKPEPHPHSQAFALGLAASLAQFRDEPAEARRLAEAVIALAEDHQFAYWGPWGHVVRGWARVMSGEGEAGLDEARQGLAAYRATGSNLMCPYFLGLLADASYCEGGVKDGLDFIDDALVISEAGSIRFYEPELYRVRAALLTASGASHDKCVDCLRQALAKARTQEARILELRALTALCHEIVGSEERSLTREQLRSLICEFPEGSDCKPLSAARAVLEA